MDSADSGGSGSQGQEFLTSETSTNNGYDHGILKKDGGSADHSNKYKFS